MFHFLGPAHCLNNPYFVFLHVFFYAVCSVLNKYVMCIVVVFIIWQSAYIRKFPAVLSVLSD
jgi:hypothetical protein